MKNIYLAYILTYLNCSWFWFGIWVLYYLRFTNYSGIGLIESVMIISSTLTEIPTGAIADLLGKKITLTASFFLFGLGNLIMGMATGFWMLIISVLVLTVGASLYSGTFEAFIYDTLVSLKKAESYEKIIANVTTIKYLALALSGVVGGFLYAINPSLPYYLVSIAGLLGFLVCVLLTEPKVDSEKFNLKSYIKQNRRGFEELFKPKVKRIMLLMMVVGFFVVIAWQMLDGILAVEFGFNEKELGVLSAVIFITAAAASQLSKKISRNFSELTIILTTALVIAVTLFVSPVLGTMLGGLSIIIRNSAQAFYENITSTLINRSTESRYRATTLSTYNMLINLPYVLSAYFIGSAMDLLTARSFAAVMGAVLGLYVIYKLIKDMSILKHVRN